jgi:diadenosine tetraphosphate (Ap4A) HIT family hydrolase
VSVAPCPLCHGDGGQVIWRDDALRIVRVVGAEAEDFPGFYRVIWQAHVAEWTDLSEVDQARCLRAINVTERAVREHLHPTKVNLASLGNVVPHLHWHVMARYDWDSRFPAPIWAPAQRVAPSAPMMALQSALKACDDAIAHGVFA